mmetsp:Transcript_44111/g.124858  ORF Transcript_44111/g.124858 Transcript_44111/m.124858 type:complete len:145 (+) Transcript_44111:78-512(+)
MVRPTHTCMQVNAMHPSRPIHMDNVSQGTALTSTKYLRRLSMPGHATNGPHTDMAVGTQVSKGSGSCSPVVRQTTHQVGVVAQPLHTCLWSAWDRLLCQQKCQDGLLGPSLCGASHPRGSQFLSSHQLICVCTLSLSRVLSIDT